MVRANNNQLLLSTEKGVYLTSYDSKQDSFEVRLRRIHDIEAWKLTNVFDDYVLFRDYDGTINQLNIKTGALSDQHNWEVKRMVNLAEGIAIVMSRTHLRLVGFGSQGI